MNIIAMFPSMETSFLLPLSTFIVMIYMMLKWNSSTNLHPKTNKNLPPSPPKLPIIGNLHQLGSSTQRSLLAMAKNHGPLILLHVGSVPMLVISSAEAAQNILKTHDLVFCSRPILKIPNKICYGSKDIAFCPYGEHWRQVKSIAVLQLLSSKRVQSFRRVREEETILMINKINESYGSLIDMSELFVSLTNNVVCRVALGKTFHGLECKDLLERLMVLLAVHSVGSYIPWLSWVDRLNGLRRKTNDVFKKFDEILESVIEQHTNKKGGDGVQDVVDILLDVQRENTSNFIIDRDTIKAVILDIFVGGTHTTSTTIEWAISELLKHPCAMENLRQEVTKIANGRSMIIEEDLGKMKYLKTVIKETLRLHPPLPLLIQREAIKDVKLMGYDIEAGTRVILNAWALGRDPSLWEDSEEFKPERFLNCSIPYMGSNYEFIPFGDGRRICPGIQFAMVLAELVIANLVYKYNFALPDEKRGEDLDMSETTGLIAHRKYPLLVLATPRS